MAPEDLAIPRSVVPLMPPLAHNRRIDLRLPLDKSKFVHVTEGYTNLPACAGASLCARFSKGPEVDVFGVRF